MVSRYSSVCKGFLCGREGLIDRSVEFDIVVGGGRSGDSDFLAAKDPSICRCCNTQIAILFDLAHRSRNNDVPLGENIGEAGR